MGPAWYTGCMSLSAVTPPFPAHPPLHPSLCMYIFVCMCPCKHLGMLLFLVLIPSGSREPHLYEVH